VGQPWEGGEEVFGWGWGRGVVRGGEGLGLGRVHFFFIWAGDGFGARENFRSWVFLGEVFRSLGWRFGLGFR
jgi:hypothetical protein